jgi:hypothetical protein
MSRINLNSLIDEVLSMAKDSQSIRKKKRLDDETAQVNQSWDDTPAGQAYWKDIRGRNTALEVGKMQNAGQMDVARENNAGQLARLTLMEDTKRIDDARTYNLNLYKEKVNENVGRFDSQTKRMEANSKINQPQKGVLGDQLTAATAILENMNSSDAEKKAALDFIVGSLKQPVGEQRPKAKPADIHSEKYINDDPAREFAKETTKDSSLIGRTRADSPDDYNIFGTKKQPYFSDFIDHSGPAPAPLRKKKIADMNENEVIAEQNLYNKKYGVNIGGKIFTLPFTPASPMDKWRKSKYGE